MVDDTPIEAPVEQWLQDQWNTGVFFELENIRVDEQDLDNPAIIRKDISFIAKELN